MSTIVTGLVVSRIVFARMSSFITYRIGGEAPSQLLL
jgi:hypothetical protein